MYYHYQFNLLIPLMILINQVRIIMIQDSMIDMLIDTLIH